jgi:hypothetical protein
MAYEASNFGYALCQLVENYRDIGNSKKKILGIW